jgi:diacylglycerol kinase family enzyme
LKVSVITNPRSREHRRDPGLEDRLRGLCGADGVVHSPADLDALAKLAPELARADVLAVHGGDGTLHKVLTAILRATGESAPIPPIALLRGGTMNIVATSVGVRAQAEVLLRRVLSGERLPVETRRTLRIVADEGPPHYGFLSGNGIVARFLELYYDHPDPSPQTAAWLLTRGAMSALVRGSLAARLTRPYLGRVEIDSSCREGQRWLAVVLGTVEELGLRFRVFHLLPQDRDSLQVVGIGSPIGALAMELPSLYRGLGVHHEANFATLGRQVELRADEPIPLMIDGDFVRAESGRVTYALGPPVSFLVA